MIRDSITHVRELLGVAIIRAGLWVAAFEPPFSPESEAAFAGIEEDDDPRPIPPVELSPVAQAMVDEVRRATAVPPPPAVVRRGSLADRIARARAGG